jgi:anti-sigma B factor antagonist
MAQLGAEGSARVSVDFLEEADGVPIVKLRGELDLSNAEELDAAVQPHLERAEDRLVIDVQDLGFADSSALALWLKWAAAVGTIEIRRPAPVLRRIIESMGLAETLRIST